MIETQKFFQEGRIKNQEIINFSFLDEINLDQFGKFQYDKIFSNNKVSTKISLQTKTKQSFLDNKLCISTKQKSSSSNILKTEISFNSEFLKNKVSLKAGSIQHVSCYMQTLNFSRISLFAYLQPNFQLDKAKTQFGTIITQNNFQNRLQISSTENHKLFLENRSVYYKDGYILGVYGKLDLQNKQMDHFGTLMGITKHYELFLKTQSSKTLSENNIEINITKRFKNLVWGMKSRIFNQKNKIEQQKEFEMGIQWKPYKSLSTILKANQKSEIQLNFNLKLSDQQQIIIICNSHKRLQLAFKLNY